ncbi:putative VIT family protein [Lyophyllum shimeji]|uniref:VIT family protein n=1 Tax=Lyophyllum shimeji TaxID=47721 RepID=A0A9P3UP62_LYOSH|nr:putative VIT family protein [Lyophyllum shimeji]
MRLQLPTSQVFLEALDKPWALASPQPRCPRTAPSSSPSPSLRLSPSPPGHRCNAPRYRAEGPTSPCATRKCTSSPPTLALALFFFQSPGVAHPALAITLTHCYLYRDRIIGLSDGITVPFALTAGLSSLGESKFVILGGVAELIAGAISMGIGGFLASQAERDRYRYLRQETAARVMRSCDGELEREVADVLGPVGVDDKTCRAVALCLREVEEAGRRNGDANGHGDGDGNGHAPPDDETASLRWSKDVGITAFLLKFGQGMGAFSFSFPAFHAHRQADETALTTQRRSRADGSTSHRFRGSSGLAFAGVLSVFWSKTANDPYGTEWLNMGFWRHTDVFREACAALAVKLIQAAQCKAGDRILGNAPQTPLICVCFYDATNIYIYIYPS